MVEKISNHLKEEVRNIWPTVKSNILVILGYFLLSVLIGVALDDKVAIMGLLSAHRIGLIIIVLLVLVQLLTQIYLIGKLSEEDPKSLSKKEIILNHGLGVFIYATISELVSGADFMASMYIFKMQKSAVWVLSQLTHFIFYIMLAFIWYKYVNKYRSLIFNKSISFQNYLIKNKLSLIIGSFLYVLCSMLATIDGFTWVSSVSICMIYILFWSSLSSSYK